MGPRGGKQHGLLAAGEPPLHESEGSYRMAETQKRLVREYETTYLMKPAYSFYSSAYASTALLTLLQLCLRFYSSAYADLSRSLGRDSEKLTESDQSASHLRNVSQEIRKSAMGLPTW